MSKINILDEDLINKIAAGEVIERPASVVKELIENSLDAQADRIEIEIKDSGKQLIKVSDNGEGMSEEDARKSVLRHATSKIYSLDDLFSIKTLGFRGEALASIAAVSQLSITTKQNEETGGFNLAIEGGSLISSGITASRKGTAIEIQNLFFNTPARKKFLKSDAVELRHIIDVVINYALVNNKVSFKLSHEGHVLVNSPAVEDRRGNIASIFGISLAKELLEVSYSEDGIAVKGFISKPYQARNDKNQQFIFVNGRAVRNNEIAKAVYDAFHSILFANKHPVFILEIALDPEKVDVNVHPQKSEIKFDDRERIFKIILKAIKETLEKNNLIPVLDFEFEQQLTFGISEKGGKKKEDKYPFENSRQTEIPAENKNIDKDLMKELEDTEEGENKDKNNDEEESTEIKFGVEDIPLKTNGITAEKEYTFLEGGKIPPLKILGQIHKTYFAAETPGGLFLIDQHAVHERVLYEQFMEQFMNKKVEVQALLKGAILEVSPSEKAMLLEYKKELGAFGFSLSEFGENTFVIKTIPTLFGRMPHSEIIYEIVSRLQGGNVLLEEIQEEIIIRMACRAAVMAGEELTINQINSILDDLSMCKKPYTCPHGRPAIIKITVDELEKKFRRK